MRGIPTHFQQRLMTATTMTTTTAEKTQDEEVEISIDHLQHEIDENHREKNAAGGGSSFSSSTEAALTKRICADIIVIFGCGTSTKRNVIGKIEATIIDRKEILTNDGLHAAVMKNNARASSSSDSSNDLCWILPTICETIHYRCRFRSLVAHDNK